MGKVAEARFWVTIFPPHESEQVAEGSSDKARPRHSMSPIVSCVLFRAIRENFGHFFHCKGRKKVRPNFFSIVLYSSFRHVCVLVCKNPLKLGSTTFKSRE